MGSLQEPRYWGASDAFAQTNPRTAIETVPEGAIWQIVPVIFGIELQYKRIIKGDFAPGDLGLGTQDLTLGFDYRRGIFREADTESSMVDWRCSSLGYYCTKISGMSINEQLGGAFNCLSQDV